MSLFTSVLKAPLKVADAISATGRNTLDLATFGALRRRRSQAATFSRNQVKSYHWPFIVVFGLVSRGNVARTRVWVCIAGRERLTMLAHADRAGGSFRCNHALRMLKS